MVQVCAIASGSNGNCYYVGNESDAVLIDVGISRRQILERMKLVGLDIAKVKAIFVSHEHTDHSKGVRVLSAKNQIPAFYTKTTYNKCFEENRPDKYHAFIPGQEIKVGSLSVLPFSKKHDAVEPCSFMVHSGEFSVGIMTDMGVGCSNVIQQIPDCHALFMESNYDEKMLWDGPYPMYLKHRVASDHGHLSNDQAYELVSRYAGQHLKLLLLSHLSAENNQPSIVRDKFDLLNHPCQVVLTDRNAPTKVYVIE